MSNPNKRYSNILSYTGYLVFAGIFLTARLQAQGNCECTNCPQFMPDGFTGSFLINVQNASNPTLGQNGQGVCGVVLNFDHEYLGDLSITLTSPSGQVVTLVGPIGFFGPTDGTAWNVTFLPCSGAPSPDAGFSATWHNNQPWGLFGSYNGSYYPASGCLENFTGPVNGTWSLTVTDGQAIDVGNFFDYEIIFCDPSGINCFSCAANAGNLLQPDITRCEGSSDLAMSLPPTYTPPQTPPPASEYSYTYVIAGPGGVIQEFQDSPDLTGYSPGTYTICGMSYLSAQAGEIPDPNGSLTTQQLSLQLNGSMAPFCGRITTNCVNVTINPGADDVFETQSICGPGCYNFYGQNYCVTGTYVRNLTTPQGCPFTGTLDLTVALPTGRTINEFICPETCSATPGFESYCIPGTYQEVFVNAAGCDSTVTLNLNYINIVATIEEPVPTLGCTGSVQLSGAGSSTGAGVSYQWTAANGGNIVGSTTGINANVNQPGEYTLEVCRTSAGQTCCVTYTVNVVGGQTEPPPPDEVLGDDLLCAGQAISFSTTAVAGATSYTWTVPTGATITGGQNSTNINVNWNALNGGDVCVTANNACGSSDPVCLPVSTAQAPVASVPQGDNTVCAGESLDYSIPDVANADSYTWTVTAPASIIAGQGTNNITIDWGGGTSASVCVRAVNACGQSPQQCLPIQIGNIPATPNVTGSATACAGGQGTYTIANIPGATSYNWTITDGTIVSGQNTTSVQVNWDAGATSGTICAEAVNACGPGLTDCHTVTLGAAPDQPDISGDATLCAGTSGAYDILAISGASSYTWTVPTGASITSGQNSTAINVNWAAGSTGGDICVAANSGCGAGPQDCFPVSIDAQPVADAGTDDAICGTTIGLQALPDVAGSSGQWSQVSGSGTASFVNAASPTSGVTVTQTGTYVFQWVESNGLCDDDDQVTIQFNASPAAGALTTDCDGANENYTVSFPVTGGTAPYTIPGGTVAGGVFTSGAIVSGQSYSFAITDANGCTTAAVTGSFLCNCATDAGTMASAALQACENQTVTATSNGNATLDANDVGAYVLHTGSGSTLGTVIAQNATGTFGFQAGMTYGQTYYISYVAGNNVAGSPDPADDCFSVAPGQPVVFNQNPTANAGADDETCGLVLTLAANSGVGAGAWTAASTPAGGSLTFGNAQDPASTATASVSGTYTLTWTLNNAGCTASDQVILDFNASPSPGLAVPDCDGANENYTISFPISGGAPPYSVNGAALAGSIFNSTAIVSGGSYAFTVTDANGCTAPAVNGSFNCDCATNAGTMVAAQLSACEGATVTAQHAGGETLDANDTTAFVLHTGNGAALGTVIAQNGTGTFGFQPGMTYGQTYYISYVVGNDQNGSPNPADPCFSVSPGQPVIFYQNPTPNAGADDAVCGNALTLAAAAGTGAWTVGNAPAGATLTFDDVQNPAATVNASAFGTYNLTWTATVNGCTGTDQVVLQFNESPVLADLVRDCDAANENYTVTLTFSGGLPPYTVNGTAISSDTFTSAAFPNLEIYTFQVADANGCAMPDVVGSYSCNCATNAGTMTLQQLTACETGSVTAQANPDATLDGNDVTAFVLHTGAGGALGVILEQNTTGQFVFIPGTMTYGTIYYISRIAGSNLGGAPNPNDPCFSVAPGQPVVFLKDPEPDAGPDNDVCGPTINLQAVNDNFSGAWTQTAGPGTASFVAANSQTSEVTVDQLGVYTFQWTEANGGCMGSDQVSIAFNESPVVGQIAEDCNGPNTAYVVSFTVTEGLAPYTITGLNGSFSGSDFSSQSLPNGGDYAFTITDANGCVSAPASGVHACNCSTDAGTMQVAPLNFCADQPAVAAWNNDPSLDSDDLVRFILHDQADNSLGTIFATSNQPSFTFNSGLQFGVTYYISAIAGSAQIGGINLNDPCLSVALGTPVQWKPIPTATLTGDATLCAGDGAVLTFSGTGQFPLTVTYSDGQSAQNTLTLADAQPLTLPVQPAATTTYTLVSVADGTTPACVATPSDAVQIVVNEPVEAGTAAAPLEFCAGAVAQVQLSTLLTGADPGGQWSETSAVPSQAGAFNAATGAFVAQGQAPGTYTFRYRMDAADPCPDDETTVTVTVHPQTVADAGPNISLDCVETSAVLGGPNTTTGSDLTYTWLLDGVPVANAAGSQLEASLGGTYTLLVNNSANCPDQDEATVTVDNESPQATAISLRGIRCFGETNGAILVDSIQGGVSPVLISLNNSPFSSQTAYAGLPPGMYVVTLQGANGCLWSSDSLEIAEPAELVAELGADLVISLGDTAHLEALISAPLSALDTILWQPLIDTARAGTPVQEFMPLRTVQFNLTVRDSNGCVAKDRASVIVDRRRHVFIPNIIMPSSGQNGTLTVFGGQDVVEIETFKLYDRWGENIFEANSFQPEEASWTGRFKGEDVLPGVYVYFAIIRFLDGEREIFTGDVTVLR